MRAQRIAETRRRCAVVALIVLLGSAAAMADGSNPVAVDDRGRTVSLPQAPTRVVVLGALYAQILVDLECVDRIVGLGESEDNPAEVMGQASVGPVYSPSVELIIALSPDLVLGATDWNGDRAALEAAGIAVYSAPWFVSVENVFDAISRVGALLGRIDQATGLVEAIRASMSEASARASGSGARVAYVYVQAGGTVYAMGTGTPESDLLSMARGENVFADVSGYGQVSVESLVLRDPEFIVTDPAEVEALLEHPVLSKLSAVTDGRVIGVPARLVTSTRVGSALEMIVEGLYGR